MIAIYGFLECFDLLADLGVNAAADRNRRSEVSDLRGSAVDPSADYSSASVSALLLLLKKPSLSASPPPQCDRGREGYSSFEVSRLPLQCHSDRTNAGMRTVKSRLIGLPGTFVMISS